MGNGIQLYSASIHESPYKESVGLGSYTPESSYFLAEGSIEVDLPFVARVVEQVKPVLNKNIAWWA